MAQVWVEFTDGDGEDGAARWGTATDGQLDTILQFAVTVLGQPDTTV